MAADRRWLFSVPLAAFVLSVAGSWFAAYDQPAAAPELGWLLVGSLLAFVLAHGSGSVRFRDTTAAVLIASASCVSAYFTMQYPTFGVESKIAPIDALGRFLSAPFPQVARWAPFSNSVGTLLGAIFPFAFSAMLLRRGTTRLLSVLAAALIALGLLLTMSRGAWLGVVCACGTLVAAHALNRGAGRWRPWNRLPVAAAFAAVIAASCAVLFHPGLDAMARMAAAGGAAFARPDRLAIFHSSLSLADDVSLTGLGPGGQYAMPYARFALILQVPFVTYPHQLALHVWLAFGVAGLVTWFWLISSAGALAVRHDDPNDWIGEGAWAGILAVLVHGLTDARQAVDSWTWVPLLLLLGLLASGRRMHQDDRAAGPRWTVAIPLAIALCVSSALLHRSAPLGAAWQTNLGILRESRGLFGREDATTRAALLADAATRYEEAVRLDPQRAGARRRLAMLAADAGDFDAAVRHARVALETDPESVASRKIAGLTATWAGDTAQGEVLLQDLPGIRDELTAWSTYWESRGFHQAAAGSLSVSRIFAH